MKIRSVLLKSMMSMMKLTPFFVKDKKFFEDLSNQNKTIVVFGHPQCKGCEEIMWLFPSLMIKAIKKGYKIRFCNFKMFPKHCCGIGVNYTPSIFVKDENGNATVISQIGDIREFIKNL